jgi:histidine triad (HIT) family protein
MSESNCLFCKIVAGDIPSEKMFETELTYAFRDINPQAEIHVLVVPRAHHEDAEELAKADPKALADLVATAAAIAKQESIDQGGFRMVFNTGEDAGRTVFHAHLHLLGGEQLGMFGRYGG